MGRVSVKAIIERSGKFLLVRQHLDTSFWCFPGGGLEPGEDLFSTLRREMIEETNVEPEIGNLLFIQQIKTSDGYTLPEFFFHVTNSDDYLHHDVTGSSHGEKELAEIDWVDVTKAVVKPEFLATELPKAAEQEFNIKPKVYLTKAT